MALAVVAGVVVWALALRDRPAPADPLAEDAREACMEEMAKKLDDSLSAQWDYKTTPRKVGEKRYEWRTKVVSDDVGGEPVETPFTCTWDGFAADVVLYR